MQDSIHKEELCITTSKMKLMMKSSPEVDFVGSDAVIAMIKATELFVKEMVILAKPTDSNEISYKNLSSILDTQERFGFLSEILPQKITVREWKEKYEKQFEESLQ